MPLRCASHETLIAETDRFVARFEGGALISLVSRGTGTEWCRNGEAPFPVEIYYAQGDSYGRDKHQRITVKLLSELAARIVFIGNDTDRELFVRLDPSTGDLCVTPSAQGARRGIVSARWNVPFAKEAALILPCVNGIRVDSDREFPRNDRFPWPFRWNAQLAVAEMGRESLMIHAEDTSYKFKALNLNRREGASTLGFESEQPGPVWQNRNAGGVEWRVNVYDGDWRAPVARYRAWMNRTYSLAAKRASRPDWVDGIRFSIGWASPNVAVLDAFARIFPPNQTLIHLSNWRTSAYDVDYPDYVPTDDTRAYLAKANEMGFKVMPHFNYFALDEDHAVYGKVRDWQIRGAYRNDPQGWYWPPESHDYTRMGFIHPGLGSWRRTIIDASLEAARDLQAPAIFIDQTLCTWNTDNGLVEGMTTPEGMWRMQEEYVAVQPDLVLAGEGLTEISFQRECFAQAHIHDGWGDLRDEHIPAAHGICAELWRGHTRFVGYYHLHPTQKDAHIAIEVYRRMGAIPTLICNEPSLITLDQPIVKRLIELAAGNDGASG
ncbi:hypothetical protein FJZ36_00190 [Candidatus Poribacteria bacterium]|nr:hypothetical protein [Candidatus Poribacteria bacterium]